MTENKIFIGFESGIGASPKKKLFKTKEKAEQWCDEMNRGERLATVEFLYEEMDLDNLDLAEET